MKTTNRELVVSLFILSLHRFRSVAQLVEHMTLNHGVQGSIPCGPTRMVRLFKRDLTFLMSFSEQRYPGIPAGIPAESDAFYSGYLPLYFLP
ncbi:MAG: hypothetical protein H6Q21_2682 [Bacteroidetes bacterium]|nr:hypothetical protein [Bacteroidota bacterium]